MKPELENLEPRILLSAGDTDFDGDVDAVDLATLALNWAPAATDKMWSEGDFDNNGNVDAVDLAALAIHWNPEGSPIPGDTVSVDLYGTTLTIIGTNGPDNITVSMWGTQTVVYSSSSPTAFISGLVTERIIWGLGGNDTIITISGVDDTVHGGSGTDSFWVDSLDTITDVAQAELDIRSIHVITEFMPHNEGEDPPTLHLDSQDIVDPIPFTPGETYINRSYKPLFSDEPTYDDIQQGYLPDCGLLAGFGSLARSAPEVLKQAIVELGDHTYAVRMYDNDDNEMYFRIDGGLPQTRAFYTPDGEIWVALLEKAVASYGGYQLWDGPVSSYEWVRGGGSSAWYMFLGPDADTVSYSTTNLEPDAMVQLLMDSLDNEYPESGLYPTGIASRYGSTGPVVSWHGYIIIDAGFEPTGEGYITVYNTWGFDGRYMAGDPDYYDGELRMTVDVFIESFGSIVFNEFA